MRNQRGFTLMELVVVLAILAVMSAMVLPQFAQRLTEERFVSAVYQVHSDLRLAQEAAKREQCPVCLLYTSTRPAPLRFDRSLRGYLATFCSVQSLR